MKTISTFLALAIATLPANGCSSASLNCSTLACTDHVSLSYELCSDLHGDATYKLDGTTCSCSGYYTGGCASCAQKASTYCGAEADLAVPQDLSLPRDLSSPIDDLEQSTQD